MLLQIGEVTLEIGTEYGACVRNTEHAGKTLSRGNDFFHGMRIGAVGRDAQTIERVHGLDEVQTFCDENEVRPQSDDLLETRIDSAAYFGFFLGVGGIIAIVRVSNEAILQPKGIDGFCETRR